jgi:hypothetical protein
MLTNTFHLYLSLILVKRAGGRQDFTKAARDSRRPIYMWGWISKISSSHKQCQNKRLTLLQKNQITCTEQIQPLFTCAGPRSKTATQYQLLGFNHKIKDVLEGRFCRHTVMKKKKREREKKGILAIYHLWKKEIYNEEKKKKKKKRSVAAFFFTRLWEPVEHTIT